MPRKTRLKSAVLLLLATLCAPRAWSDDVDVEIAVNGGSISDTGDRASLDLTIENGSGVTVRLVGLVLEYDTPGGDTLSFESRDDFDVRVEPAGVAEYTGHFSTEYAQGVYVDWRSPYTTEAAIGADIAALTERAESSGSRADRVLAALSDVSALGVLLRRSQERFPDRVAALPDAEAWFDAGAVAALREPLEQALCAALGRRVSGTRGSEARVEAYRDAARTLGGHDLYPECMGRPARLAAARALVATGSAQDALVLTERDEAGEVLDEWRDLYIAGRLALAELAVEGEAYAQFRPGIDSLGEIARLEPGHRRLADLAERLLSKSARQVASLIADERELDALRLTELMRESFADHPQTEAASVATANALLTYARRSLEGEHPVRANNAWVRGLASFGDMPVWAEVGPQIQVARRDYFVARAHAALAESRLEDAEEELREAEQLADLAPDVRAAIVDQLLIARWTALGDVVAEGDYENAVDRADALLADAERPEVLGEARAQLYLDVAAAIWDRYGMLSGIASRTRLGLAEEALEKGREADPEVAAALATRFKIARWLFPAAIATVVLLAALVILVRGNWRKRRKARRLWRSGLASAERGDAHKAAKLLGQAWSILDADADAASVVGEESRGHLVLQIAAVQSERGRKDVVDDMRIEWRMLEDFERPYDPDFEQALEQFRG